MVAGIDWLRKTYLDVEWDQLTFLDVAGNRQKRDPKKMKDLCKEKGLDAKVRFEERMPYKDLMQFTFNADLGLTLDKGDSGNYIYALPNKIMDYLVAGTPTLGSPMHEAMGFIQRHDVGMVVTEVGPKEIARSVEAIFSDTPRLNRWKENAERTRAEVNWAMESERLKKIYEPLV